MKNTKSNLNGIFDFGEDPKLDPTERQELYKSIIQKVRRKRVIRIIKQTSAVAAVLIFALMWFFISKNQANIPDIKYIALQTKGAFHSDDQIQIASIDLDNKNMDLRSVSPDNKNDEGKLTMQVADNKGQFSTIYVPFGRRQEVVLPDGSTVWLNAGSFLTINHDMERGDREVYLNGEGYFDIKQTGKRFVVRTQNTEIAVLGTSFNTSSYEDESVFSIELLTGKVELNSPDREFKAIKMTPGERVTIDSDTRSVKIDKGTSGEDILWTKKQIALKNVKMRDLLKKMERIYNVKINADREVYALDIGYSGRLNIGVDITTSLGSIYELRDYNIILKEKEVFIIQKK